MLSSQQHHEIGLLSSTAGLHQPNWGQTLISCVPDCWQLDRLGSVATARIHCKSGEDYMKWRAHGEFQQHTASSALSDLLTMIASWVPCQPC